MVRACAFDNSEVSAKKRQLLILSEFWGREQCMVCPNNEAKENSFVL